MISARLRRELPIRMEVDWDHWEPSMRANLLFVQQGERVLLIRKKTGLGSGKINGPGGKLEPGETAREAAVREIRSDAVTSGS